MPGTQHPSAGDSQGRARLNKSTKLKVVKYLTVQWKPWLHLTSALKGVNQESVLA